MEKLKNRNINQFDGEHYNVWKVRVLSLLRELKVIKVIDQSQISDQVPGEWTDAENTAKNVLLEYLADSFVSIYSHLSAKEILSDMDKTYARRSLSSQIAIRKQLLNLKLKGDTSLKEHFKRFTQLITELQNFGGEMDDMNKIALLLTSLPSTYDGVTTAIETMSEETVTLAFVKKRLLDHETKMRSEMNDTSTIVLHAETTNEQQSMRTNNNKMQDSQQMGSKRFKRFKKPASLKCYHCGRQGHVKNKCIYYKRALQFKNNMNNKKYHHKYYNAQRAQLKNLAPENNYTSSFAFMAGDSKNQLTVGEINFILDSGATHHIVNRSDLAANFERLNTPIKISIAKNNTYILATKRGSIHVKNEHGYEGELLNVLYCDEIPQNLLSVPRMQEAGYTILFDRNGARISYDGKIITNGKFSNNLININLINNNADKLGRVFNTAEDNYDLWHQRLGHISRSKFVEIKNKNMVSSLKDIENVKPNDNLCEACIKGKQSRLPFNSVKDKNHVKRPLYIVHSDVCGPITPSTINDKNYFVLFVAGLQTGFEPNLF